MLQLLAPERVAIASTDPDQHVEESIELNATLDSATEDSNEVLQFATQEYALQSNTITPEVLKKFRRGYGEHAAQVAQQLKKIVVTSAEEILRKAKLLLDMKLRLNRKEWGIWLREVLGWFGSEATPYLQIGKVFKDFDPSVFRELEPFTILKLRTKRYAPVVTRLREELAITSDLIQNFIKEVIPKQSRRKKVASNFGEAVLKQRVNAEDGTFYFSLNANLGDMPGSWLEAKLENCTVGQVLEQAAALERQNEEHRHDMREGLDAEVEQRVRNRVEMAEFVLKREIAELKTQLQTIANPSQLVEQTTAPTAHQSAEQKEAIALRAQHKSSARLDEYSALQPEEQQTVVDDARSLPAQNSSEEEELPSSDRTGAEFGGRPAITVAASECEVATGSDEVGEALEAQLAEFASVKPSEQECAPAIATDCSEPVEETTLSEMSDEASTAEYQPLVVDWDVLKQLRSAEGFVQEIDVQIKDFTFKLEQRDLGPIVKQQFRDFLTNRQNLRITKISQIVNLADSKGIRADYEQLQSNGRIILAAEYASVVLKQAKSWSEVVLVVGCDYTQLKNAVLKWTLSEKQLLVQLLTEHLETEPNAFDQIDWIPEKLLNKVLHNLTFTLEKIRSSDNLVDEPEIEQFCGCKFKSVANIGNVREQWFFQVGDKVLDAFGRSGFAVEKF